MSDDCRYCDGEGCEDCSDECYNCGGDGCYRCEGGPPGTTY